jgi:hypothetical protein
MIPRVSNSKNIVVTFNFPGMIKGTVSPFCGGLEVVWISRPNFVKVPLVVYNFSGVLSSFNSNLSSPSELDSQITNRDRITICNWLVKEFS